MYFLKMNENRCEIHSEDIYRKINRMIWEIESYPEQTTTLKGWPVLLPRIPRMSSNLLSFSC